MLGGVGALTGLTFLDLPWTGPACLLCRRRFDGTIYRYTSISTWGDGRKTDSQDDESEEGDAGRGRTSLYPVSLSISAARCSSSSSSTVARRRSMAALF